MSIISTDNILRFNQQIKKTISQQNIQTIIVEPEYIVELSEKALEYLRTTNDTEVAIYNPDVLYYTEDLEFVMK